MEPKDFFRVVWRRKRTVITAIIAVMTVAMWNSMGKTPTYAAGCKARIFQVGPGGSGGQISDDAKKNPTETYASFQEMSEILQSPIMAKNVSDALGIPYAQVANKINAAHEADTGIFNLTAISADADLAVKLCNGYMVEFIKERVDLATARVKQAKDVLIAKVNNYQRQLSVNEKRVATAKTKEEHDALQLVSLRILSDITDVNKDITDLDTALSIGLQGGGEVVQPAAVGKLGPSHERDGIMALIIGLVFGSALALAREYLDDTVRDKEAVQRDIGLPVLASMPSSRGDDPFADDGGGVEAARMLRTNLASQGLGGEIRCVVVTSTLSKRSPTALAQLASAIAEAGRTVLVVGADFRQPRVHEAFGIGNAVGLTNVIRGQVTFDKAIRPVPGQVGVYVMPSGPVIGNPGELLSTEEMAMVIRRARKWADIVLVDAPPVLAAADASVLGTYADGVLMVMSAGQTLRAQANEAKEQLKAAGARLLGTVIFGASEGGKDGKVHPLPMLRRGDDDIDFGNLTPYGGFDDDASFGGSSFGGSSFGGGYYDSYDDDDYDDEPPARPAPRVKPKSGSSKPAAKNGTKKPAAKKKGRSVAASSTDRVRHAKTEIVPAPRRAGGAALLAEDVPVPRRPAATPERRRAKHTAPPAAKRTPASKGAPKAARRPAAPSRKAPARPARRYDDLF